MAVFAGLWGPEVFETPDRILLQNHPFAVYNAGTNVLATLYTDRTKVTVAPNPSATDAFGNGSFYAEPDLYELEVNDFRLTVTVELDPEDDEGGQAPVTSVNTQIGDVVLDAADVGADATGAAAAAQAFAIQRANHTGSQSADTLSDGATNKAFTAAERTKLAALELGGEAFVWDPVAGAYIEHGRIFIGPVDPDVSYAPAAGDAWIDTLGGFAMEPPHVVGAVGEPPFLNNWTSLATFGPVGFYKDAQHVYLMGVTQNTGDPPANSIIFNLPVGYRPGAIRLINANTNGGVNTWVQVNPNGDVLLVANVGASGATYFDGLFFRL